MRGGARLFALVLLASSLRILADDDGADPAAGSGASFPILSSARPSSDWRYLVEGGQAFASTSQHFAEFAGAAVSRDLALSRRVKVALELFPVLVFNETRADQRTRERVVASALAVLVSYAIEGDSSPWGLRFDLGTGGLYGYGRIPAAGSRFNFFNQLGGFVTFQAGGRTLEAGYRWVHVSNAGLVTGTGNPGLTFHALVLGVR